MSSLIKETNRLISKRNVRLVDVLLVNGCSSKEIKRYVKHLILRKTDVLKTLISSEKDLKKCTAFEEQNGRRYIRVGNVYFGIIVFSCLLSTKPWLRYLSICFDREIKGFYQSTLENEFDFTNIMNVSVLILAKN